MENQQVEEVTSTPSTTVLKSGLRLVKIPKQDFKTNKIAVRPFLDQSIVNELKEVFDLFSETDKVNPHDIKNGLRSVSKKNNNFLI